MWYSVTNESNGRQEGTPMIYTTAEMTADAKLVYKSGGDKLVALADKYGATSRST